MYKVINKAMTAVCYLPYVYLIFFYSFVIRAILKTGRIPTYNNPDPKELQFGLHREWVYRTFDLVVYGLAVFSILFLVARFSKNLTVKKTHLIFLIVGIVIILFHLLIDPFEEWFLD